MEPGEARNPLSQLRRGVLEFCVLSLLRDEQLYGFDLVRRLGDVDGLVTTEGTIYPLLSRLRRDGWVTTSWVESEAGPPRRYYALAPAGAHALDAFTAQWRRFRDAVDHLLGETHEHPDH
jgi:PadR family transcriptional regulator